MVKVTGVLLSIVISHTQDMLHLDIQRSNYCFLQSHTVIETASCPPTVSPSSSFILEHLYYQKQPRVWYWNKENYKVFSFPSSTHPCSLPSGTELPGPAASQGLQKMDSGSWSPSCRAEQSRDREEAERIDWELWGPKAEMWLGLWAERHFPRAFDFLA